MKFKSQLGQSSLLIVFIIGMAALFLSLGFSELATRQAQVAQNTGAANKASYAAHAGIEDVILHLRLSSSYGEPAITLSSANFNLDGAVYYATTSSLGGDERIATSTGKFGGSVKTIEIKVLNSEQGTGFLSAVQTGNGGFLMEQGALICAGNGSSCTGNTTVYSNGSIEASKIGTKCAVSDLSADPESNTAGSTIIGSATAFGTITGLGGSGDGPCIFQNASASALTKCEVLGDASAPNPPGASCNVNGSFTTTSGGPPQIDLPEFNPEYWRVQATNSAFGGSTYTGNCNIGGTPDCSSGLPDYRIGPKKIAGNLTIESGTDPMITGPIWVTGDFNISSNNNITIDPDFVDIGTVVMSDGKVISGSNVLYPDIGLSVVLIVSTRDDSPSYNCGGSASVEINSNVKSVIFYAYKGCVEINSNSKFYGAVVGQKVHMNNNAVFYYNELFKDAIFGVAAGGGWLIESWRNID